MLAYCGGGGVAMENNWAKSYETGDKDGGDTALDPDKGPVCGPIYLLQFLHLVRQQGMAKSWKEMLAISRLLWIANIRLETSESWCG